MMLLAIDPGPTESAYVILDEQLKPVKFDKILNLQLLDDLDVDRHQHIADVQYCAIEMIASYGMAVGKEIFDTCVWIGRFWERANFDEIRYIYRIDEKMNLCQSMKARDSNVIQALVDRFAPGQPNHGKGTKRNPGWFYGFSKDIWQAYAVGVTFYDFYIKRR